MQIDPIEDRLLFVIGPPRSGTTLLMRMLAAHSAVYSRAEPHVFGPLAHLGYYDTVDVAPYDQLQAAQAMRELVADLPRGEADYLDACRAYVDILYGRLMVTHGEGKRFFLDKTPANALVLPFLSQLFPQAHYVVLTRHPAAVFTSFAESFFDGDFAAAERFNPILARYVPAMARFLRQRAVPMVQVAYEALVRDPAAELRRVCDFIGVQFEESMVEYGRHDFQAKGLGDPITVNRQTRPVTQSVDKWAEELIGRAGDLARLRRMVDCLDDRDLATWGFPRATLWQPLERAAERAGMPKPRASGFDRFRLERKLLVFLRRDIQTNPFGKLVRKVRMFCDVLLRG